MTSSSCRRCGREVDGLDTCPACGEPTDEAPSFPSWAVAAEEDPPPAGPSWAVPAGDAPPAARSPAARLPAPSPPAPATEGPGATSWVTPSPRAGGFEPAPPPPPAPAETAGAKAGAGPWAAIAAGAVVLLVLVLGAAVLAGREDPAGPVVGACFAYAPGTPAQVERVVPCDGANDGVVVAEAADRAGCPAGTDAVLTAGEAAGGRGVLCVDEP